MQAAFKRVAQFYNQFFNGRTQFAGVNLSEATLDGLLLTQVCDFTQASFQKASLIGVHMPDILMEAANLDYSNLTNSVFKNGFFKNASFCNTNLTKVNFSNANLAGANFSNANLSRAKFHHADLRGVNFKNADLTFADFTDSIFDTHTVFDPEINPVNLGMKTIEKSTIPMEIKLCYRGRPIFIRV